MVFATCYGSIFQHIRLSQRMWLWRAVIKLVKKIIKFISIILIGVYGFKIGFDYLEPVYEAMCNEKVKYTATIITNQQSTIVMNQYKYEELYTIEKDSNGNVSAIKSNVVVVNNIISDLTEKIQQEFEVSLALFYHSSRQMQPFRPEKPENRQFFSKHPSGRPYLRAYFVYYNPFVPGAQGRGCAPGRAVVY